MTADPLKPAFTQKDFQDFAKSVALPIALKHLVEKGEQYVPDLESPAFANLDEMKAMNGLPMVLNLMVLATKQWRTMSDWSRLPSTGSAVKRQLVERVLDVIVYSVMFLALLQEVYDVELPSNAD